MPTPTHEHMTATVHAYAQAFLDENIDAVAQLYASNAVVEDPVGSAPYRGIEAVRAFYTASIATGAKLFIDGPVRTAGNVAAFAFAVRVTLNGVAQQIDVIDTFTFDDHGKVVEMRAYWGPQNVHPF